MNVIHLILLARMPVYVPTNVYTIATTTATDQRIAAKKLVFVFQSFIVLLLFLLAFMFVYSATQRRKRFFRFCICERAKSLNVFRQILPTLSKGKCLNSFNSLNVKYDVGSTKANYLDRYDPIVENNNHRAL